MAGGRGGSCDELLGIGGMAGGDDILAGYDGHQVEWGYGVEGDGRDDEAGSGRQLENGSMDWDEQYRRMSVDDRLLVELSSVGLLPVQPVCVEGISGSVCFPVGRWGLVGCVRRLW